MGAGGLRLDRGNGRWSIKPILTGPGRVILKDGVKLGFAIGVHPILQDRASLVCLAFGPRLIKIPPYGKVYQARFRCGQRLLFQRDQEKKGCDSMKVKRPVHLLGNKDLIRHSLHPQNRRHQAGIFFPTLGHKRDIFVLFILDRPRPVGSLTRPLPCSSRLGSTLPAFRSGHSPWALSMPTRPGTRFPNKDRQSPWPGHRSGSSPGRKAETPGSSAGQQRFDPP